MHPVLFNIGSLTIRTYSVMLLIAFVVGIFLLWRILKRRTLIDPSVVTDLAFWVIIAVVVGARFAYVFLHMDQYADNFWRAFNIMEGGAVYYGGFVLAFIVGFIFIRIKKLPVLPLLDAIAAPIALGEGIGRIGCFFNGCCFGQPSEVCAVTFRRGSIAVHELIHAGEIPATASSVKVYATQLFQSGGGFLLFGILIALLMLTRLRRGQLFSIFLFGFGGLRFGVNFFRFYEDAANYWTNQAIALALMATGLILFFVFTRQEKVPTLKQVAAERKRMAEERAKKEKKGKKKSNR